MSVNTQSMGSSLYKANINEWSSPVTQIDSLETGERVWLGQNFDLAPEFDSSAKVADSIQMEMNSPVVVSTTTNNGVEENELPIQATPKKGLTPMGWGVIGLVGYMLLKGK